MMPGTEAHIARINEKLQQLVKQQQRLRKENEELRLQLTAAEKERGALSTRVEELLQVLSLMKVAAGNMNDKEKKEFEKQVNKFIRDIDKMIAFLSQ